MRAIHRDLGRQSQPAGPQAKGAADLLIQVPAVLIDEKPRMTAPHGGTVREYFTATSNGRLADKKFLQHLPCPYMWTHNFARKPTSA